MHVHTKFSTHNDQYYPLQKYLPFLLNHPVYIPEGVLFETLWVQKQFISAHNYLYPLIRVLAAFIPNCLVGAIWYSNFVSGLYREPG
jgi:hypothetical protein